MSFGLGSVTVTAATTTSPSPIIVEDEEYYSSWSLFLVCMLLILSLWTSYYLQIKRIRALIVRLAPGTVIREMLTFKHTLFFNLLLPPIILNSGYELKQALSSFTFTRSRLESLDLTLLECLTFGSTLSATDPVTILAIFNQYKVDPKLLLNDAVSIVMYETLTRFHGTEIYLSSIFHGIGIFLLSFSVSMALGVAFGLATSLLLKHSSLNLYPHIESCLVALAAYTCYFFSNGLSMSGIVSLLFCGITLKHYAYHTMSRRTQRTTKYIFATLAQLSENFIFIYLGLALFTSAPTTEKVTNYVKPIFITITTIAVVFTRYAAVFPLSEAINFFHKHARGQRTEELPHSYQMMLFWAGLRGAVGVALAAGFQGNNANTLRITVLAVVVLTVLVFGGTTARMLEVLGIRTGVEDEGATDSDEEDNWALGGGRWPLRRSNSLPGGQWSRYLDEETNYLSNAQAFTSQRTTFLESPAWDILCRIFRFGLGCGSSSSCLNFTRTPFSRKPSTQWYSQSTNRRGRTFHARRARRSLGASGPAGSLGGSVLGTPAESEDEGEGQEVELGAAAAGVVGVNNGSRMERGLASPMLRSPSSSENRSP
ncbi:Sodium/hydrogen exchanger family-domain-containing protein [Rhodocollybia butyracea]|uniref:Sodium/hydrogen exchanger n=1 Tax=Rhodocollybia butyracea TaxID=206335 RepID=A0A9P5Q502_9AGAR|nr:Sodium/hydrogen exchanger family-domain-containing protein [Rhodocollybia butyracea]